MVHGNVFISRNYHDSICESTSFKSMPRTCSMKQRSSSINQCQWRASPFSLLLIPLSLSLSSLPPTLNAAASPLELVLLSPKGSPSTTRPIPLFLQLALLRMVAVSRQKLRWWKSLNWRLSSKLPEATLPPLVPLFETVGSISPFPLSTHFPPLSVSLLSLISRMWVSYSSLHFPNPDIHVKIAAKLILGK